MTVTKDKVREHNAVELLRRYGKLLLKKHNHHKRRILLLKIKKIAMELAQ
jgi:hypothetical protein